jgi:hypothetical protein
LKEIRDYLVEVELKIDFLCENFMAQTVLNTRKLLFLSNHEIIWNKIRRLAGVRPQSKVAGDCTLAPDPGGCALSEGLSEEGASSEEGGRRNEEGALSEEGGRRKEKGFVC